MSIGEAALVVAIACGYLALVVAMVWGDPHCSCCVHKLRKGGNRK